MKQYPAILSALYNTPHLITETKLREIAGFIERRVAGERSLAYDDGGDRPPRVVCRLVAVDSGEETPLTRAQLAANTVPATSSSPRAFVAVLPLFGTLFQHGGDIALSGGTSTAEWTADFRRLAANAAVKTILIETHSPGGQVFGTDEAASAVRAERESGRTRIVSIANSLMASAATWIATAADEVYVTPGGEIGSIGVVTIHTDYSKYDEKMGIKTTLISTHRKKIEGNPYEPLDAEARTSIEADLQVVYQRFVAAMAANRRTTAEKVESDFGGGGMLFAADAQKAGLADGVATLHELMSAEIHRLKGAGKKSVRNRMAIEQAKSS